MARFGSRCRFAIAAWTVLIAFAAGSARAQVVPPQATVRRPRVGLAIAGVALFTATWVPTVILTRYGGGCDDDRCRQSFQVVWYPIVGPLLARDKNPNFGDLAVLWALSEAAGVAMAVVGVIGHQVPVDPAPRSSWRITPTVSPGAAGLSFNATF